MQINDCNHFVWGSLPALQITQVLHDICVLLHHLICKSYGTENQ